MSESAVSTDLPKVTVFTDGASRGNPGPGGFGVVMRFTDSDGATHVREISAGYRLTTNNRMEILAVIAALEALNRPCEVDLYSDSQYVVNAFEQDWISGWLSHGWKNASKQPVKNPDLWQRLLRAKEQHTVHFLWVKGHAGDPLNERCDELATAAADSDELLEDTGFAESDLAD